MTSNKSLSPGILTVVVMLLVFVAHHAFKLWVKTHMAIGDEIHVSGDWFILHFTENPGMAFGMKFWGIYGKLVLSVFRLVAIGAIGWLLHRLVKRGVATGMAVGIGLVLAGAVGNMIDSAFYGLLFDSGTIYNSDLGYWMAYDGVSQYGGGYAGFLQGCVVDMFYFPIIDTTLPNWVPIWGGEHFVFFRPVFNLADAAITCGVIYLLLFERKSFQALESKA